MTGRHVKVGISPAPNPNADVNLAQMSLRERLMRWLFGPMQDVTLIVPGHKVDDVTVTTTRQHAQEEAEAELSDDDLMALADAITRHPAGSKLNHSGGDAA